MTTFAELGLSEALLRAIDTQGYDTPSPIQDKAIPPVLNGEDVMAAAQTGTGKTAAFTLPLLQRLQEQPAAGKGIRALVITPTRELAAQVEDSVSTYGQFGKLRSHVVFGGVKINPQIAALRRGVDILVATPGRLLDLHSQGAVDLKNLEVLILDEADRMLDMGFIHDIRRIVKLVPTKRQTLMFSATFSKDIRDLARQFMHNPVEVSVTPANTTAETVQQWVYPVDKGKKPALLSHLITEKKWHQVLVFTRTKHGANRLTQKLEKDGIVAAAIHGNKSQGARTRALEGFKKGKVQALIATDIAARGLDIEQLPQVVNFDLPNISEDYVHRIGRTGRAGATGLAYSLVSADEADYLFGIEKLTGQKLQREQIAGFEPSEPLPERSSGNSQPRRHKPRGNSRNGSNSNSNKNDGRPSSRRRSRRGGGQRSESGNR